MGTLVRRATTATENVSMPKKMMRVGSSTPCGDDEAGEGGERAPQHPRHLRDPVRVDGGQLGQLAAVDDGPDRRAEERPLEEEVERAGHHQHRGEQADLLGVELQRTELEGGLAEEPRDGLGGGALHPGPQMTLIRARSDDRDAEGRHELLGAGGAAQLQRAEDDPLEHEAHARGRTRGAPRAARGRAEGPTRPLSCQPEVARQQGDGEVGDVEDAGGGVGEDDARGRERVEAAEDDAEERDLDVEIARLRRPGARRPACTPGTARALGVRAVAG